MQLEYELNERTTWFLNQFQKPFYEGIYEVKPWKELKHVFYAYWNGKFWGYTSNNISSALGHLHLKSVTIDEESSWRGLTSILGEELKRSYFLYIPQNTGWSGGVSWFDTFMGRDVVCKTLQEAKDFNSLHSRRMNDPSIKYRVTLKEVTETYYMED